MVVTVRRNWDNNNNNQIDTDSLEPGAGSPLTTKGDLYTFDTNNTRLPVGADTQLLSADSATPTNLKWIPSATVGSARETLTANRTYLVDPIGGNDANNGLTPGTAFLTIQKAIDTASLIDPRQFDVDIQLADGTYDTMSVITLKTHLAQNTILIKGNNADRTLVLIDDSNPPISFATIVSNTTSPWGFQDLTIGNSSIGAGTHYCINSTYSNIELIDCRLLGTGNTQGINLDNSSLLRILISLQIEGTFGANMFLLNHSFMNAESTSFNFISSPTVTTHIFGVNGSAINFLNISNSGSLTGTRYDIRGCTALRTTNGLDTDIAGSIAGSTAANAVIYN